MKNHQGHLSSAGSIATADEKVKTGIAEAIDIKKHEYGQTGLFATSEL